jgi:MFS family permease
MGLSTLARFLGGPVLDNMRFKIFFGALMVLATIMSATFMLVADNWWLFSVYYCISLFLRGSSSVSQPIFFATVFGPDVASQAFSFFFTAQSISPLILTGIISLWEDSIGIQGMFWICTGTSAVALLLTITLNDSEMIYGDEEDDDPEEVVLDE